MKDDVAIVCANFGGIDEVRPQQAQDIKVDWVYFTDDAELEVPGWTVKRFQPNGLPPTLAAKRFKCLPPVPHRYVIWIDANVEIVDPNFAEQAIGCVKDGIAVHVHPFRDCIYDEALATLLTPKYDGQPVAEQIISYRDEAHPRHFGLYACGVIAWDRHGDAERLGRSWLGECEQWTYQDQLSFPVVCRRLGITPGRFPHQQYQSPWFHIFPHRR